jgi:hypothetical protein
MKDQGYHPHAGLDPLCSSSRLRLSMWAKTPKGFEPVVKELKHNKNVDNPWAVAWSMKNKGIRPKASKEGPQSFEDLLNREYAEGQRSHLDMPSPMSMTVQEMKDEGWSDQKILEHLKKFELKASPQIAKNGLPYENYQSTIRRPLGRDEHTHGTGSDQIRHQHGPYENGHVHENVTNEQGVGSPEKQMENKAFREGEGVQEQGLGEGRGRKWVNGDLAEPPIADNKVDVGWTIEESRGAESHGYKELDFEAYPMIGGRDWEDFTDEEKAKFDAIDKILTAEKWHYGGADGAFLARVDFGMVPAEELDEYKRTSGEKLATRLEQLLAEQFGAENVEVTES